MAPSMAPSMAQSTHPSPKSPPPQRVNASRVNAFARERAYRTHSHASIPPRRDNGLKKKLWPLLWGDGYITAGDKISRRAFVEIVLRQLRRAFHILTEQKPGPMAKLASRVGIRPPEVRAQCPPLPHTHRPSDAPASTT